jgi:hypothetical protein
LEFLEIFGGYSQGSRYYIQGNMGRPETCVLEKHLEDGQNAKIPK